MTNKNLEKIAKNLTLELQTFCYKWHIETIELANKFNYMIEQRDKKIEKLEIALAKQIEKNKALRKLEDRMNNITTNLKG